MTQRKLGENLTKVAAVLLLSLFCLSSVAAASVTRMKLSFEKSRRCPTTAASLLPQKLTSKLQCAAFCSRLPTCNAFHFNKKNGQCFHGDACSQLEQWTADGDCDSYKYTDVLCGDCDVAEPVLTELKLKLFYKFSRSGLKNEVNPRQFCLTAHDVTVDGGGAHFKGNTGSYLTTETAGFERYLGSGSTYSTFAQVHHSMTDGTQYYTRFQSCSGAGIGSSLIKKRTYFYGFAWLSLNGNIGDRTFGFSTNFLPTDGAMHLLSAGFTFNKFAHEHMYENGSFVATTSSSRSSLNSSTAAFQCLRLGFGPSDDECLNGSMSCFALSTKLLSGDEFHLLEQLCK